MYSLFSLVFPLLRPGLPLCVYLWLIALFLLPFSSWHTVSFDIFGAGPLLVVILYFTPRPTPKVRLLRRDSSNEEEAEAQREHQVVEALRRFFPSAAAPNKPPLFELLTTKIRQAQGTLREPLLQEAAKVRHLELATALRSSMKEAI